MNTAVLRAMRAELEKLATAEEAASSSEFLDNLKPGDIVVFGSRKPKPNTTVAQRVKETINPLRHFMNIGGYVGGGHRHVGMYMGKGQAADINWPALGTPVYRKFDLGEELERHHRVLAVRPETTERMRREAVEKMKRFGERSERLVYDSAIIPLLGAAELGRSVTPISNKSLGQRLKADKMVCSTAIGRAYRGVNFNERKPNGLLMPKDFVTSDKTKVVAEYRG